MKVAHQTDYDTHAIIGGKEVESFGIAQTAEFFEVLSSTLYSNKPLAVIREVLCNAWDSHIVSGITKTPIKITLNESNLIIRDFGKGIHPDNMRTIYCVYGASTKENDGNQTGGFGLGSKAPFAYSHHFTVTTFHEGKRTVYAISRGSQLTKGKPDLRVMVQVPSPESGLEVNIPIKDASDIKIFKDIIKQIASFGEMNVLLNEEPIPVIPLAEAENNLFITRQEIPNAGENRLFIRYGNVVYPIPKHEDYKSTYSTIVDNLNKIPDINKDVFYNRTSSWRMLFQAPPNSISVTPSRESLSMTDTTVNTLKNILIDIDKVFNINNAKFQKLILECEDELISRTWLKGLPNKLLTLQKLADILPEEEKGSPLYFNNIKRLARYMLFRKTEFNKETNNAQRIKRLKSLINNNYRRKNDLINLLNHFKHNKNKDQYEWRLPNYFMQLFRGLIKDIYKNPDLKLSDFYISTPQHGRSSVNGYQFTNIKSYKNKEYSSLFQLFQGVVIFTTSKTNFAEYYNAMPEAKIFQFRQPNFVYVGPRNKDLQDKIKAELSKLGFHVIDFSAWYERVIVPTISVVNTTKTVTVKPIGLPSMENLSSKYDSFNIRGHRNYNEKNPLKRIENPEYIFKPYSLTKGYSERFFSFGDSHGKLIVDLFGKQGGIVANEQQYDAYLAKGAKRGEMWLAETIIKEIKNNPRIMNYITFNKHFDSRIHKLIEIGYYSTLIRNKLKLPEALSEDEKKLIEIFEFFENTTSHAGNTDLTQWDQFFKEKAKEIRAFPESQDFKILLDRIENRENFLNLLDLVQMSITLKNNPKIDQKIYIEIALLSALNI